MKTIELIYAVCVSIIIILGSLSPLIIIAGGFLV